MTGYVAGAELDGLTKRYDAVVAVDRVSFAIRPGEVLGLVGENGAGKSTLISLVSGAQAPDAGTIRVAGVGHPALTPAQARDAGILAIRQEPVLVPSLSVRENLLLGREPARMGIVDRAATRELARTWLERVGARIDPEAEVGTLSPADRQLVEIARAVGPGARVLFFDEPTAALGPAETQRLFELIARLRSEGTAVVYVSHRLEEVFAVCERVVVMRDGHAVADEPIARLDEAGLVVLMAGHELAEDLAAPRARRRNAADQPLLALHGLSVGRRLQEVSLTVAPGEIHGIAGIVGAGRTSLVEAIAGVVRPTAGRMVLAGEPFAPRDARHALAAGVVVVPEDRLRDALFSELSLATNTVLPRIERVARRGLVDHRGEARAAQPLLDRLSVKPRRPSVIGRALSGGNQQKVILARALFARPRVLLLDEPTRGIDVGTKADIHRLIRDLAAEDVAIMVVSSDLRELLSLADRITVLARGRVAGSFGSPYDGHRIMAAATGAAA